jgi:hypothetical protein
VLWHFLHLRSYHLPASLSDFYQCASLIALTGLYQDSGAFPGEIERNGRSWLISPCFLHFCLCAEEEERSACIRLQAQEISHTVVISQSGVAEELTCS